MSISNTIQLLQAKHAKLAGVKRAPVIYPSTINSADLPLAITVCGPGWCQTETIGSLKERRDDFVVTVLAQSVALSNDDAGIQKAHELLDAFCEAYSDANWYALANSPQTYILTGAGPDDRPHHSGYLLIDRGASGQPQLYHGFQFTVPVMEVS
jgi:hypothetical protein